MTGTSHTGIKRAVQIVNARRQKVNPASGEAPRVGRTQPYVSRAERRAAGKRARLARQAQQQQAARVRRHRQRRSRRAAA